MGDKDSTMENIKAGKGLPPLASKKESDNKGIATENRGDNKGIRYEWASLNPEKKKGPQNE